MMVAVSIARASGLATQRAPRVHVGARCHCRTSSLPAGESGTSRRPCIRRPSFHVVRPWRRTTIDVTRARRPMRRGGRTCLQDRVEVPRCQRDVVLRARIATRREPDARAAHGRGSIGRARANARHHRSARASPFRRRARRTERHRYCRRRTGNPHACASISAMPKASSIALATRICPRRAALAPLSPSAARPRSACAPRTVRTPAPPARAPAHRPRSPVPRAALRSRRAHARAVDTMRASHRRASSLP